MKKNFQIIALINFFIVLFASRAEANIPIYQISNILSFSNRALFETSGKTFLAVVLIEMVVLRRFLNLGYKKAFLYSFLANLFSTILGFATSMGSSMMMAAPIFLIGSIMLSGMSQRILYHDEHIKKQSFGLGLLLFFCFLCVSWLTFSLAALTTPGKSLFSTARLTFESPSAVCVAILAALGLLAIGYLISVITEGYVLSRLIPQGKKIIKIVLLMNLFSYMALVVLLSPAIKQTIAEKTWFFYRGPYPKSTGFTVYEEFSGKGADYSASWMSVLKEQNYFVTHYWPEDGKELVNIESMQKFGIEWVYPDNFPQTINIRFSKNDQNLTVAEISFADTEDENEKMAILDIHQKNDCLTGVFKESLVRILGEKGYLADTLTCTTGRWSKSK